MGPGDADLVIDLGAIGHGPVQPLVLGITGMLPTTPQLAAWRSLTVAGTGFPQDLSGFSGGQVSATARTEWQVWSALIARSGSLPRIPTFGDYGISHPDLTDIDPRLMQPSAAVRYTAADEWLIVKGRSLRRHKFTQFHQLSGTLVARPEFSGAGFSWGDTYIQDCAQQSVGVGNQTTWRKVGTSHHLAYVVRQIANQGGTSGAPAPPP